MAPVSEKASQLMLQRVRIAGIKVRALIDTGATASCCRWGWFKKWASHLGPKVETNMTVIGVGNCPITVKGITQPIKVE